MEQFCPMRAATVSKVLREAGKTITIARLDETVGGLSKPSKMPWYSYSLPALACRVGSMLRDIPNSVCSKCYAMKGRYQFPNVAAAMERRLTRMNISPIMWAGTMRELLARKARGQVQYFRWHDSGDLQHPAHLAAIMWIARELPHVKFWLPTKEYHLISANRKELAEIDNLTVRVSAAKIGGTRTADDVFPTSSVGADTGFKCPAYDNGGKCGDCRACWDKTVLNVDYPLH